MPRRFIQRTGLFLLALLSGCAKVPAPRIPVARVITLPAERAQLTASAHAATAAKSAATAADASSRAVTAVDAASASAKRIAAAIASLRTTAPDLAPLVGELQTDLSIAQKETADAKSAADEARAETASAVTAAQVVSAELAKVSQQAEAEAVAAARLADERDAAITSAQALTVERDRWRRHAVAYAGALILTAIVLGLFLARKAIFRTVVPLP